MKEKSLHERYQRQTILKGFGERGQQKLQQAKILVIGAGGLGCPALQYLVAGGVGTIGIVDDDMVSLSNLHRQVLYTTDDIDSPKAEVAASKLRRLNTEVMIVTHTVRLKNTNALDIIRQYDLVIDGTDNFASRYMINDACVLLGKPLVYGAVSQYEGQVAVFNVKDKNSVTTNYRDLFPYPPKDGEVLNCAEAGVLGVLPGIIGTMQAAEVIKLITCIGEPLINRLLTYNLLNNVFYEVALTTSLTGATLLPKNETEFLETKYDELCSTKGKLIVEIDAEQFETIRKKTSAIAIDVREKGELPLVTNFKHRQIPMSFFKETMKEIEEQTVVLFCQHGIRSLYAAEMLQEMFGASKEVYSLKGGIVKWGDALGISVAQ
jgi:adenylyltransferase/sulfurtransferase